MSKHDYYVAESQGISVTRLPTGLAAGSHWLMFVIESETANLLDIDVTTLVSVSPGGGNRRGESFSGMARAKVSTYVTEVRAGEEDGPLEVSYFGGLISEDLAL